MSRRKDLARLLAIAHSQGFTIRRTGSGHLRVTGPNGAGVTVPSTPGRGRSMANTRADLRRIGAVL